MIYINGVNRNQAVLFPSSLDEIIDKNNLENNTDIYKRRQAIVEHPFGTIKRQWGTNKENNSTC